MVSLVDECFLEFSVKIASVSCRKFPMVQGTNLVSCCENAEVSYCGH